jgi:hypothetical protein
LICGARESTTAQTVIGLAFGIEAQIHRALALWLFGVATSRYAEAIYTDLGIGTCAIYATGDAVNALAC